MKLFLSIIVISTLTCCQWLGTSKTDAVNDGLSATDSLNNLDNQNAMLDEPCIYSNPDTSVFGIRLLDQQSSMEKIGSKYVLIDYGDDLPHLDFMTLDYKQVMTLYFQPGSSKNVFSEIEVRKVHEKEILISLQTNVFDTNRGIKLGMTLNEVLTLLGECYSKKEVKDSLVILNYIFNNSDNFEFFKDNTYTHYSGNYYFNNDTLIQFRFGFIK